tara:strand:+ start:4361 stop:5182 length:822 start_codon:yes stop_codon:yes gene_type:complete
MRVVIFGSNGMLGGYMTKRLSGTYTIVALTRKDYDIGRLSIDSLTELLTSRDLQKDDVVINCAGVIPQSSKQRDLSTRLYFTINSLFPVVLSQVCDRLGAVMIHITTDCVFSGKGGKYDEDAVHDETNDYGMSKSLGELCAATIIRTSIIGEEKTNKRSLLEWVRSNKGGTINGYTNHFWNGVTCLQLAKLVATLISGDELWSGVRHIHSPTAVSKYELVNMINDIYELGITVNEFRTEEAVDKTLTSNRATGWQIPELEEQIREMRGSSLVA